MARTHNRLTARKVEALTKPGRHADGGGLYLSIRPKGRKNRPNGGKNWVFLFSQHGKRRELGFGSVRNVSLAQARELAAEARRKIAAGESPRQDRRSAGDASFAAVAARLIEAMRPGWRNARHATQWRKSLFEDAKSLAHLPVDKITTQDVLAVLKPLWLAKPETASRTPGRIERVLDAAAAEGLRSPELANPARWRGHLENLLPKRRERPRHHPAMPFAEVPVFLTRLRAEVGIAARALEFTILTAMRTGEVLGARWDEFDLERAVWTVPSERMKGGKPHRVPLSAPALAILTPLHEVRTGDFGFPGRRGGHLSATAMMMTVRRTRAGITVHGFRSSFSNWAREVRRAERDVVEKALAHTVASATERAYWREDLIEPRRALMEAWGAYCAGERGEVVGFPAGVRAAR